MIVQGFRELRAAIPEKFKQEKIHPLFLSTPQSFGEVIAGGIAINIISWLLFWMVFSLSSIKNPGTTAGEVGFLLACVFWIFPFLSLIHFNKSTRVGISCTAWHFYSVARQLIACFALTFILGNVIKETRDLLLGQIQQSRVRGEESTLNPTLLQKRIPSSNPKKVSSFFIFTSTQMYLYGWPLGSIGLFIVMFLVSRPTKSKKIRKRKNKPLDTVLSPFRLWLGKSTGELSMLWHPANLASNQEIGLTLKDATQNILILGAIGSGKTTKAMHPLLLQLLDQDCGGLIFDIKGDFKKAVLFFSDMTNRNPIFLGVNQHSLNLLEGLSPEISSSFLKSAFLLAGNNKSDGFWIDTAVELCRNALGILSFLPEHYHLNGLYRYLFDKEFQEEINNQVSMKHYQHNLTDERLLKTYQHYLTAVFSAFDEKIRSGVLANVAQILSPFQHPDLVDAFCTPRKDQEHSIEALLEGEIYVVDMPLAKWGVAGRVIYTLIKLRFFNLMQQRTLHEGWNKKRPVFFMCDEYQEIVSCNKDGLSDLNFWDKSRSSQTIGIISAQSISSFYAAIGDRDLAHALMQNFRQKLIFRTEDDWTIQYCNRLLGQVETQKIIQGVGKSTNTGGEGSTTYSSSQTISYQQKDVIDGKLFRTLRNNQVLALLSLKDQAADDILETNSLFVPEKELYKA